jgi:hypothetical protein
LRKQFIVFENESTFELNVFSRFNNVYLFFLKLMVTGAHGHHGQAVTSHVVQDLKQDFEFARILLLQAAVLIVLEMPLTQRSAKTMLVLVAS